jgi:NAD(P)-dependent dehydrogenase (short-subunit alcohol dehydrogenase family)
MSEQPVCVVVGVGPGNGASLCRRFAAGGYRVAALARSLEPLSELVSDIDGVEAFSCDASDPEDVAATYEQIRDKLGDPAVLLYNASARSFGTFDEVNADDLERSWKTNALGLFLAAKEVLPSMRENEHGVIGVTGATASTRGVPFTTAFAQGKAAQHHLAESLAREFGPQGVHVFIGIIDGVIDLPRTREMLPDKDDEFFLQPDDIAESFYQVAHQPKSAWTFKLDLRPYGEDW